ncbi:substrate-binding domain-containing protein [Paenibacillus frigoriresistens]|uniref:substrate-binding domain-containing protein n=1 Tax=Paenibacillus alginolyticus TaxID=59839 RepID=UPI001567210D|nr:substrate-binding domain-containing protein [Paenibacillus frigoriresistens]NRF93790.1 substrate-binding domain-containing protein [Paenibacillus frigoriresistens]
MKNLKILLLLVVAFALTACGKAVETKPEATQTPATAASTAKAADPAQSKKIVIGLTVQNLSNPFFVAMSKGAAEAAKKHGAEVITVSAEDNLATQTAQIEDFITKKVSMIILSSVDTKGIAAAVGQAKAAGIPIISVDTISEGGVNASVTSDNVQAGRIAGEYLVKRLNGKGNIAILDGPPVSAVTDRIAGFNEALKAAPGIKVVANQNGNGNRETSLAKMETILQANGKGQIDAVFAINDPSGIGAKIAAEQAGRDKEMFIVGVDGSPDAVTTLKENKSYVGSSAQNPFNMITIAVETAFKILKGEKVEELIKLPTDFITTENVKDYKGW